MGNEFGTTVNAFGGDPDDGIIDIPDTSEVQSNYWAQAGRYKAEVVGISDEPSKKGDKMLTFEFAVDVSSGRVLSVKQRLVRTPGNMFRIKQTTEALGLKSGRTGIRDIIGRKCIVELRDSEYNGEKTSEIARCYPLGTASAAVLHDDEDDDIPF